MRGCEHRAVARRRGEDMMNDDGLATALAFADDWTATNALVNALNTDPDVESRLFGDMLFFDHAEKDAQLVYDADDNRFWTAEEYADSPFPQIMDTEVKKATVFRQQSGDPLEPATYTADGFDDGLELFSNVYQQEYDGLIVLHTRDGDPVVYDRVEERFWDNDEYQDSVYHAMETVTHREEYREMLDTVHDHIRDWDTYSHFKHTSTGTKNIPAVMGFAADGEGFTLGRKSYSTPGQEEYMLAYSRYDPDDPEGASVEDVKRLRFKRSTLPTSNWQRQKHQFARDHILTIYAEKDQEVRAAFEDAYKMDRTTPLL